MAYLILTIGLIYSVAWGVGLGHQSCMLLGGVGIQHGQRAANILVCAKFANRSPHVAARCAGQCC